MEGFRPPFPELEACRGRTTKGSSKLWAWHGDERQADVAGYFGPASLASPGSELGGWTGAMAVLDAVVTVDTSVAHLAGALFEADLFGPVALIKAVLAGMRARRRGHIVNVSSIGGLVTYPGVGYYHTVKFGVEALSDALAKEVSPLGIGVTVVAPGAFRTDFRGPASMVQSAMRIDDYAETAGRSRAAVQAGHGKQQGDPARGARAIIAAVAAERPPVHLLIGGDALDQFRAKLDDTRRETDAWEEVTRGTDFRADDTA